MIKKLVPQTVNAAIIHALMSSVVKAVEHPALQIAPVAREVFVVVESAAKVIPCLVLQIVTVVVTLVLTANVVVILEIPALQIVTAVAIPASVVNVVRVILSPAL